ncbi:hypothetical protein MBAV_001389 [Candidatus Magnetobacterium bavaricum]|uniref:Uncharacterized protein n=1 Tax=Candidatus Magnetobacterium bavaricum TaxID=29290 RepID=A0A0F3GX41_9BACT|nr:hypothetical protein MBAV_001389 [Candidatus Magnetobacterium bavaricum]
MLRPPRSLNVYISLSTISVLWPMLRVKTSVYSMIGTLSSLKPYRVKTSLAVSSMTCHR